MHCTDGTARLTEGVSNAEGRLEVYYNGQWGTVCGHMFSYIDAGVVCDSLGFGFVRFFSVIFFYSLTTNSYKLK